MTPSASPRLDRMRRFVLDFGDLVSRERSEPEILNNGMALLADLVRYDDWLPDAYAKPDPLHYCQYLLHCDSRERFSVIGFVWGPGQATPIHDHRTWGLIGMLRGAEIGEFWQRTPAGTFAPTGVTQRLEPGNVGCVSPNVGDIHRVRNAFSDRVSISIHVYGVNIGMQKRASYEQDGAAHLFVSGYSNDALPNFWRAEMGSPQ